jgi:hypothetical protein
MSKPLFLQTYVWTFPEVDLPAHGEGVWETCSTPAVSGKIVRLIVARLPWTLGVPRGWWWGRYYRKKRATVDFVPPGASATIEAEGLAEPVDAAAFLPTAFGLRLRDWDAKRGRALVLRFRGQGRWMLTALIEVRP